MRQKEKKSVAPSLSSMYSVADRHVIQVCCVLYMKSEISVVVHLDESPQYTVHISGQVTKCQ